MIDLGDFVVLGRVPIVARMLGSTVDASSIQWGDIVVFALIVAAVAWGCLVAWSARGVRMDLGMLAVGGGALYLTSVAIAGFGYGYKAAFLLLVVPLASLWPGSLRRIFAFAGLGIVLLLGVESVVVWNTVLATLAGLMTAGFGVGAGMGMIARSLLRARDRERAQQAA